jgi:hypothetical protein
MKKLPLLMALAAAVLAVILGTLMASTTSHQVVLTWTASTSTGIEGYNVYRVAGDCPAPPTIPTGGTLLNTTGPVTTTTYTDASPLTGAACYYVQTVGSTGSLSLESNDSDVPAPASNLTAAGE